MTEADATYTSILLPAANIMMFANDPESVESLKFLAQDWRFARVQLHHQAGGIAEAIAAFKSGTPSPDLLIVETDTIDSGFTQQLETLAQYCSEGTAAIVIGPVNDVNLYRKLIAMGISDYLVRPVRAEALSFDVARTLIERIGATGSRLIAVAGSKGGVGATVTAEILAAGTSEILNQKTILMDAAGGWSTLSVGMNFEPAATIAEAIHAAHGKNEDAFNRMIFQSSDKLHVLSTGSDMMLSPGADAASYESLIDKLMSVYPVVIVDLSQSPSDLARAVMARAHEIIIVTTPMLSALRAARTLMGELRELRSDTANTVDLVINMAGMTSKYEVGKTDIEQALDRKPSIVIDYDPTLFIGTENEGRRHGGTPESKKITRDLLALAGKVLDVRADLAGNQEDDGVRKNPLSSLITKMRTKA